MTGKLCEFMDSAVLLVGTGLLHPNAESPFYTTSRRTCRLLCYNAADANKTREGNSMNLAMLKPTFGIPEDRACPQRLYL